MTVTPGFLKVAVYFHTLGRAGEPTALGLETKQLEECSFITKQPNGEFEATPKLTAWVAALCKVPFPVEKWVVEWPKNHQA